MRMQDDAQRVEELLHTEAVAAWAGTRGIVEGEQLRLERRHTVAALRAGVAARKHYRIKRPIIEEDESRQPAREPERGLEGLGEALRTLGAHAQAIDDCLDSVSLLTIELRERLHLIDAPIDAHAHESLRGEILEEIAVLSLALTHDRREQRRRGPLGQAQHLVDHLAHRLRSELDAVIGAARYAGACVQ